MLAWEAGVLPLHHSRELSGAHYTSEQSLRQPNAGDWRRSASEFTAAFEGVR